MRAGRTLLCALCPCRKPGNDSKMLVCETCDKGYHTFCLKPPMEELPAHSWKCKVSVLRSHLTLPGSSSCSIPSFSVLLDPVPFSGLSCLTDARSACSLPLGMPGVPGLWGRLSGAESQL